MSQLNCILATICIAFFAAFLAALGFINGLGVQGHLLVLLVSAVLVGCFVGLGGLITQVKFYGMLAEYEFSTFLTDIIQVSRGETTLSPETRNAFARIKEPVHVQVFVTPTCPYCPGAVSLAHQFAIENSHIQSDMVEVSEFPQLAVKYNVMGVPKTVINESIELVGLQAEEEFLRQVQAAARPPKATYA